MTLTGAEYDALTQRADDWYALYAKVAKERAAALEDVERWKRSAELNIEENVGLRLAEEGAKEAFGHVVQQKRDLEAECKRLRRLLYEEQGEALRQANMRLLNLLALIHRDGGHHTMQVDVAQSLADAEQVIYKWRGAYDVLVPHNAELYINNDA